MPTPTASQEVETLDTPFGTARIVPHAAMLDPQDWRDAFDGCTKDARYYQLCETALPQANFDYRYLLLRDQAGRVRALQPLFFTDQDLLAGLGAGLRARIGALRRRFPRFMSMKMLMVGCTAGEGHLGLTTASDGSDPDAIDGLLEALEIYGRKHKAAIITFKDFSKDHRPSLTPRAARRGFVRMPSFPATTIALGGYSNFEDYLARRLSKATRKSLRRKFRPDESAPPLTMEVLTDVSGCVDELHPLYLQVLARSAFRFEELTKEYFVMLGRTMGDRARFFVWRQGGEPVALSLCMVHRGVLYDNYLGMDYAFALSRSLYFLTIRDLFDWAVAEKLDTYYSTPLAYEPKLHLRFDLEPLDLYVRHLTGWINPFFKRVAPLLEPTRYDKLLPRFANYADLA